MSGNLGSVGAAVLLGFGAFGDSIESIKQTNFFQWFCLEQTGQTKDEQRREITEFRPNGEKFRRFVSFKVTRDSAGRMLALELALDRAFVDSPQDSVFAADIAKSFILSAASDEAQIKGLAHEIELGSYNKSGTPVLMRSEPQASALPEHPSPGYATYLDSRPQWRLALSDMELSMRNESVNGQTFLHIKVSKQKAAGSLSSP